MFCQCSCNHVFYGYSPVCSSHNSHDLHKSLMNYVSKCKFRVDVRCSFTSKVFTNWSCLRKCNCQGFPNTNAGNLCTMHLKSICLMWFLGAPDWRWHVNRLVSLVDVLPMYLDWRLHPSWGQVYMYTTLDCCRGFSVGFGLFLIRSSEVFLVL